MTSRQVSRVNQQSKGESPLVSGVLQRAAVRAVADKEGEGTQEVESGGLSQSRFVHDFTQVPIDRGGLPKEVSKTPNQTGLPDNLKAGVENLSGYSLDDVRVHYNSPKPAQLQALAYTHGTEIHVAPGQERHLPHEAWHVVQQMQGRVKPTIQMKGVQINDDEGLEREADVIGAKALQDIATKQAADEAGTQAKLLVPKQLPIQRYLKVGPIMVEEKHIEFIYEKICQEAINILQMWEGSKGSHKNSPTWIAYRKGIPEVLLNKKTAVKEIITRWAKSSGVGLPTIAESVKEKFTGERGEKAEWKEFSDYLELALAIGYELDLDLQENKRLEADLGAKIMENYEIAQKLDVMRLKVMHWIVNQYQKDDTSLASFKAKFKLGGSYNFSSQSKVKRDFDALLKTRGLSVMDNIEILHDLMEVTSDKGAGSFFQKFGKVLAGEVRESAYHQIGVDESDEIYEMRPMKTKSDHGPGGAAWKGAKHYTLKMFEVEFQAFENRMKEKVSDEFEMVELGSPVENVLDPKKQELMTRYKEKRGEKMSKAMKYERKAPETTLEQLRDTVLMGLDLKAKFKPTDRDVLDKRSKGRHNVGTRDEYDPVTILARAHNVPIEAGRSMTTARILELCTQALNDDPEGRELHERGKSELDAVAQGIFAYWAAQYNQALTPIHTYHEVMDVARHYGVEYTPFHYKIMKAITMETESLVPMDSDFTFKIPPKVKLREERREQPYRITDAQRDRLSTLLREAVWIDPNGDCLYNALSAVGAEIGDVNKFRNDLAQFLLKNPENYKGFIEDGNTVEEVAEQIAKPGSYYNLGGDMTPLLIADYLNISFSIMNEDGTYHDINAGDRNRLVIRVTNPLPHFHSTRATSSEVELSDL